MKGNGVLKDLPELIQGGMGVAVSSWRLAKTVAGRGHLGVVSGTAIDRVVAARLQEGDRGGHLKRAMEAFPDRALANRVFEKWYRKEGLETEGSYQPVPMFGVNPPKVLLELAVIAAFTEVWLAKEGVKGPVGINLLEKIQAPTLPTLYGALLAGVDYVLMGAGIPKDIPDHIESLARHESCALKLSVENGEGVEALFDPSLVNCSSAPLARPRFLAVVSSHVLAMSLARKKGVFGFVVEGPLAGGHNAPPRGWDSAADEEPAYGEKDYANLDRVAKLGLPFWLAGGQNRADSLALARESGAVGIQVGTAFAFCSESGMDDGLRRRVIGASLKNEIETKTEGRGSPTGFPFKTLNLVGTEGGRSAGERKRQSCVHGYLRTAYRKEDGGIGWRCAAEPEAHFAKKGGSVEDIVDRRCLCNGLLATAGHAYAMKEGGVEKPLLTSGHITNLRSFMKEKDDYSANDVIDFFAREEVLV